MSAIGPTAAQDGQSILVPLVSLHGLYTFLHQRAGSSEHGGLGATRDPLPSGLALPLSQGPRFAWTQTLCFVFLGGPGTCGGSSRRQRGMSVGRVVGIQQAVVSLGVLR